MAENKSGENGQEQPPQAEQDTSAGSENTETSSHQQQADKDNVPRTRLNEEINRRKDAEKKAADLEKAQRERAEKAAKEAGEWQTVAEQREARISELEAELARLKPMAERAEVLETSVKASLKTRLDALPDQVRKLGPGDDATSDALSAWLPGAEELAKAMGETNGQTKNGKDGKSQRGASPTPRASDKTKERGEILERARASQAGFTARNF